LTAAATVNRVTAAELTSVVYYRPVIAVLMNRPQVMYQWSLKILAHSQLLLLMCQVIVLC